MQLPDVNVLVAAFRGNHPAHEQARGWLERLLQSSERFGLSEYVLSGFLRVVTHRTTAIGQVSTEEALAFTGHLLTAGGATRLRPGTGHWAIFTDLLRSTSTAGGRVSDAYHAALAIENDCEWVTFDRDFARFPGLRWTSP
jgi:toxin-antitoxin system PIN domain toxin